MDRLQAMQVFTRIVELNSFSRAADSLNLPHATATILIQGLEARLRVRLMQRTTRKLNLTPEGSEYYEHCVRILAEISEKEDALSGIGRSPKGKLRIAIPELIGRSIIVPQIGDFTQQYPDIDLMIGLDDKPVEDGVDCAIRTGNLEDSSLVVRRLGELQTLTAASPIYLERHGMPASLDDLKRHLAVRYFSSKTGKILDMSFVRDKRVVSVKMGRGVAVNDAEAYVICGLKGLGIVQAPRFMLLPHIESGSLVELFPHSKPPALPISAVYPRNRHLASKVRVFVDWAVQLFANRTLMSCGPQIDIGLAPRPAAAPRKIATTLVEESGEEVMV